MKSKTIVILTVLLFSSSFRTFSQNTTSAKKAEYCILRVFECGFNNKVRGIWIVRENLKVEKFELKGTEIEDLLTATMEYINLLKNQGFVLVTSSLQWNPCLFEYVFKKE